MLQELLQKMSKEEKVKIESDALHLITQCAQGSVRDAISLLDQIVSFKSDNITEDDVRQVLGLGDRILTQEMFSTLITKDLQKSLDYLNQVDEKGIDLKLFADGLLLNYRHLILLESTGKVPQSLSQSEADYISKLKGALDLSLLLAQYQVMFQTIQELSYAEFPKTSFELALVKLSQIQSMLGLAELVDQIKNRKPSSSVQPKTAPVRTSAPKQQNRAKEREIVSPTVRAANWYELVKWIANEKPPLAALLKDAVPVSFSEEQIEVAISSESQAKAILVERTDSITSIIKQHFGKDVSFQISNLDEQKKKPRV